MLKPVHRVLSLIGSASGCKFRLTDSSVSRFHGSLLQTSAGLWVVDLLGQRGITINDVPVRCSRLVDGDIVRIGRYQIRIRIRLRGQGSRGRLFDLGRAAFAEKGVRQSRTPISSNPTRWTSTTSPFCSSSADGQESPSVPIEAISMSSRADLVPSNSMFPINLPQSQLTESMLVPLVNQFGLMQQQMFDQFQQAMAMVVQMFGTMHRDQMEVIRAELDRLHELTDEFHALKNELAERTREKVEIGAREPDLDSARFDRSTAMDLKSAATPPPYSESKGSSLGSQVASVPSLQPPTARTMGRQSSPEPHVLLTQPSSSSPATDSISEPVLKAGSQATGKPGGASPAPGSDRDTVLWLHQRIMVLQRERESRWQRILKLMPGMSSS
jgi:FHA domain